MLLQTLPFLDALLSATSLAASGGDATEDVRRRWELIAEVEKKFQEAGHVAEAHLPDSVVKVMDKIWKLRVDIWANQTTWCTQLVNGGNDPEFFRGGFGKVPAGAIDALRLEFKTLVQPLTLVASAVSEQNPTDK